MVAAVHWLSSCLALCQLPAQSFHNQAWWLPGTGSGHKALTRFVYVSLVRRPQETSAPFAILGSRKVPMDSILDVETWARAPIWC